MSAPKVYLGDGAFAAFDGFSIILTTSDGLEDTNTIYLEPNAWATLEEFVASLRRAAVKPGEGES